MLLARCLKFMEFDEIFERLALSYADKDDARGDALILLLAGNARMKAIRESSCRSYSTLIAKIRQWYRDAPSVSFTLTDELRRQVEQAQPLPNRQESLPDYIERFRQYG